jgi:hypothetical protein
MTKENYLKLKNNLKSLSQEIRKLKTLHKEIQRSYSLGVPVLENITMQDSKKIVEHWKAKSSYCNLVDRSRNEVESMKAEIRHKHIMYSLIKGRSYEQIEPKVREGNEPNWSYIDELKKEYGFDEVAA